MTDHDGEVLVTLCGVVERIDKLVYVRTLRARYALPDPPPIRLSASVPVSSDLIFVLLI